MKRAIFPLVFCLALATVPACGSDSTSPDTGTSTSTITETFSSLIQEKGSATRSFKVDTAGTVGLQLITLSQSGAVVGLALGTFSGTTCTITKSVQTASDGTSNAPQISSSLSAGDYCVRVSDVGNLNTIVTFTVYITKPAA